MLDQEKNGDLVRSVGFIMDGNRRFGQEEKIGELKGHWAGKDKFLEVIDWVVGLQIPHAVFYAFSSENWQRNEDEVKHLLNIFREILKTFLDKEKKGGEKLGFRIRIIGQVEDFPLDIQEDIKKLEEKGIEKNNKDNIFSTIWIALSYGGRKELVSAIKEMTNKKLEINENNLEKSLWSYGLPDLDLLIRTGGEKRLSNFLPWQLAYAELFFVESYWPAFTKAEFIGILEEYGRRTRRFGK